jgi:hypothetical protein
VTIPRAVDPATGWLISPIVAAALCIKPRGLLTPDQVTKIDALKSASPEFTMMRGLAMRFRGIFHGKDTDKLDTWLSDAQQSGIYAIQRFARTLRRDTVAAAIVATRAVREANSLRSRFLLKKLIFMAHSVCCGWRS